MEMRESVISCFTMCCRFNMSVHAEPHCILKMVCIKDGMCTNFQLRHPSES